MDTEEKKSILVYGGNGAVGNGCVTLFKNNGWKVISIGKWKNIGSKENSLHDEKECNESCHVIRDNDDRKNNINKLADVNLLVHHEKNLSQQQADIIRCLENELGNEKFNAIICVAGAFESGTIEEDFPQKCENMWKQNVWPSIITAGIAKKFLKEKGFVCLSGASAALKGTPNSIAYGMAKAAVHHITKSLALSEAGLPENSLCVAILPITIDTLMNRQVMPESDMSAWTPTKYIVDLLYKWSIGKQRPGNGSLIKFVTQNFNTDIYFLQ